MGFKEFLLGFYTCGGKRREERGVRMCETPCMVSVRWNFSSKKEKKRKEIAAGARFARQVASSWRPPECFLIFFLFFFPFLFSFLLSYLAVDKNQNEFFPLGLLLGKTFKKNFCLLSTPSVPLIYYSLVKLTLSFLLFLKIFFCHF